MLAWALPIATLAMVPKCPACVVGYILLFTGIGISLPAAGGVRWALIAACVLALAWLTVRAANGIMRRRASAA